MIDLESKILKIVEDKEEITITELVDNLNLSKDVVNKQLEEMVNRNIINKKLIRGKNIYSKNFNKKKSIVESTLDSAKVLFNVDSDCDNSNRLVDYKDLVISNKKKLLFRNNEYSFEIPDNFEVVEEEGRDFVAYLVNPKNSDEYYEYGGANIIVRASMDSLYYDELIDNHFCETILNVYDANYWLMINEKMTLLNGECKYFKLKYKNGLARCIYCCPIGIIHCYVQVALKDKYKQIHFKFCDLNINEEEVIKTIEMLLDGFKCEEKIETFNVIDDVKLDETSWVRSLKKYGEALGGLAKYTYDSLALERKYCEKNNIKFTENEIYETNKIYIEKFEYSINCCEKYLDNCSNKDNVLNSIKKYISDNKIYRDDLIKIEVSSKILDDFIKKYFNESDDVNVKVNNNDISDYNKEIEELEGLKKTNIDNVLEQLNTKYDKDIKQLNKKFNNEQNNLNLELESKKLRQLNKELEECSFINVLKKNKLKQDIEITNNNINSINELIKSNETSYKNEFDKITEKYEFNKEDLLEKIDKMYVMPENPNVVLKDYNDALKGNVLNSDIDNYLETENIKTRILKILNRENKFLNLLDIFDRDDYVSQFSSLRVSRVLSELVNDGKIDKIIDRRTVYYSINDDYSKYKKKLVDDSLNTKFSNDRRKVLNIIIRCTSNNEISFKFICDKNKDMKFIRLLQVLYSLEKESFLIKKVEFGSLSYLVNV